MWPPLNQASNKLLKRIGLQLIQYTLESKEKHYVENFIGFNINTKKSWNRQFKWQGAWLRAGRLGFDPRCRRDRDFLFTSRVQTGHGIHSASYKMNTGDKVGRAQDQPSYLFLMPWLCILYVDPRIHFPRRPSWPVMELTLFLQRNNEIFQSLCENTKCVLKTARPKCKLLWRS